MAHSFISGQRWISETEPELGLGSVRRVTERTVTLQFGASEEVREYALDNTPLRRVRFQSGDAIKSQDERTLEVETVTERRGLIYYRGPGWELCETELSDALSFNKPEERLLAGQLDDPELFDLRSDALKYQHLRRKSKVHGFVGGRIDLIPHQLYITAEVAGRLTPRVLLADEVGLGKTIEACLILHRLILTGRARRVLILVPESLVHQWFVELLRRFNLWFHIFDEERCAAIETTQPEANPFLDDQLVLASISLLAGRERRTQQALAAGWDLLIVDEAHHLGWSPELVSPEYALVESLGRQVPSLLLLTATPEQLGQTSHFARLRLLDPDRYYNLEEFIREADGYRAVARLAEALQLQQELTGTAVEDLVKILARPGAAVKNQLARLNQGDEKVRQELINALLDQHGTGRVMFRNTRSTIAGFPRRQPRLHQLELPADQVKLFDSLAEEFAGDIATAADDSFEPDFTHDPRIAWLVDLLQNLETEKILLICRTLEKVEAIDAALRQRINVKTGIFHEGLTLLQRDRNAAWFAEAEGARILLCSEIGSEGRNFQFAHHLVFFDLPLDPELLEQRIGRLDRIGQTATIQLHVPFVTGSSQEVLARWHAEGLHSFEKNLHGGCELLEKFGARVRDLAQDFHETESESRGELQRLIAETQTARSELVARLEQGRDRLLELNSFRPAVAETLVQDIRQRDADESLDEFMTSVFDHHAIQVEELSARTYLLGSAGVFADSFPGLPAEGLTVTCDRQRALSREDVQFLTWDHPLVTAALDLLLGSEKGNSSFGRWSDAKRPGLFLETIYLLECIAPPDLHADRFLPPTPLRVVVDHRGQDAGKDATPELLRRHLRKGDAYALLERPEFREDLFPHLLESALAAATRQMPGLIAQARREMAGQLDAEIARLKELQQVNPSVRPAEIDLLVHHRKSLDEHLQAARLRLDSLRLIQRGPG